LPVIVIRATLRGVVFVRSTVPSSGGRRLANLVFGPDSSQPLRSPTDQEPLAELDVADSGRG
jgi:hypothetical protein